MCIKTIGTGPDSNAPFFDAGATSSSLSPLARTRSGFSAQAFPDPQNPDLWLHSTPVDSTYITTDVRVTFNSLPVLQFLHLVVWNFNRGRR